MSKTKKAPIACVVCGAPLSGKQTMFCGNPCKQKAKYARYRGRSCEVCHKPISNPVPVLGGFKKVCQRKACVLLRKRMAAQAKTNREK